MKIVCISDVHGKWNKIEIPECDILISAGDYSFTGEQHMIRDFHEWMCKQPAKHKISVQGNHEKWVEKNFDLAKQMAKEACPDIHFVDEGLVEMGGLKIWCSAITPFFCNWAWNRYRGDDIQKHWDKIPANGSIDLVVTHGPCHGIFDDLERFNGAKCEFEIEYTGCLQLLNKIIEIRPKAHICGHIHEHGGKQLVRDGITFVNASICDENYKAVNPPIILELK